MDKFLGVAIPVAKVLIPIGLGLLVRVIGVLNDADGAVLRKFVVRFTVPLFVFFSIYESTRESLGAIGPMVLALPLYTAALFALGWVVALRFQGGARRASVHACITFCNYGWLGYGVAYALLGVEGLQRVIYFLLFWWPIFYAFGLPIGYIHVGRQMGGIPFRRTLALALPSVAAMLLGLGANLGGVKVPPMAVESLKPLGEMTVPIILLSVGMMLDFSRLHREVKPALLISAITLVIGPLIAWGVAALLTSDRVSFAAIVLEGAMPVATVIPLLEENHEMDGDLVNTSIILSTVLSLVSLPIVALFVLG
jgi:predicted permease